MRSDKSPGSLLFLGQEKKGASDNERPIPQPPGTPLFLGRSQEKEGAKVAARRAIRRRARKVKRVERSDDQAWQRRSRRRAQLAPRGPRQRPSAAMVVAGEGGRIFALRARRRRRQEGALLPCAETALLLRSV